MFQLDWSSQQSSILSDTLNFKLLLDYFYYFNQECTISLVNLKGFDLSMLNPTTNVTIYSSFLVLNCINCRVNFYKNRKLISSCNDLSNADNFESFFQISQFYTFNLIYQFSHCEFPTRLCPLVFNNSKQIDSFNFIGLMDTFYKKRLFQISNETIDTRFFYSNINQLSIYKAVNLRIDLKLLNPLVFNGLMRLSLFGFINSIDIDVFHRIESLKCMYFQRRFYSTLSSLNHPFFFRLSHTV